MFSRINSLIVYYMMSWVPPAAVFYAITYNYVGCLFPTLQQTVMLFSYCVFKKEASDSK